VRCLARPYARHSAVATQGSSVVTKPHRPKNSSVCNCGGLIRYGQYNRAAPARIIVIGYEQTSSRPEREASQFIGSWSRDEPSSTGEG
jgi:hypothetical protein